MLLTKTKQTDEEFIIEYLDWLSSDFYDSFQEILCTTGRKINQYRYHASKKTLTKLKKLKDQINSVNSGFKIDIKGKDVIVTKIS